MRAEDALRRYLEQRRELGERELVLDQMTVEDVMRILGASGKGRKGKSTPEPRGATSIPADVPQRQRREKESMPSDWREALQAAGASQPEAAKPSERAKPSNSAPSERAADIIAPTGLVVGGGERELFGPLTAAGSLEEISAMVASCTRCPLYRTATHPVPGEGNPRAQLMCVGEAPGANEDATGRPFVGQAGQLLTKILAAIKLTREEVFIANVLKHRPPGNRNPNPDEVTACRPYLVRQIELVQPKVIVAFGTFAAQTLLETKLAIGKLRGSVHRYHGVPLIVTYHPAALLRNPAWKRPTWEDVQLARRLLDNATA